MSLFRKILGKGPASHEVREENEEELFSTKGDLGPRFLSDPEDAIVE